MADPLTLRIAVGDHPHVQPLKQKRIVSPRLKLEFKEFHPLPKAFRAMVRADELDASEMAVVTHLLAHRFARPIIGIAIPLWSRLPHANLICPMDCAIVGPSDLHGHRVGVRAYAQTSGVWVRGILKDDYGVDPDRVTWVTMEDAHLAEYKDPPITVRNEKPVSLRELMMAGDLAAIMGEREVDPSGIRTVVPSGDDAARQWIARTGITPINHIVTVRKVLIEQHPWLARELMELFEEARRVAEAEGAPPPPPYGIDTNRQSLQVAFDYSADQRITDRRYLVDELFLQI